MLAAPLGTSVRPFAPPFVHLGRGFDQGARREMAVLSLIESLGSE